MVLACRDLGVIHGDIKDENILVNVVQDRPEIQLIDFGSGAHFTGEVFAEFGGELLLLDFFTILSTSFYHLEGKGKGSLS